MAGELEQPAEEVRHVVEAHQACRLDAREQHDERQHHHPHHVRGRVVVGRRRAGQPDPGQHVVEAGLPEEVTGQVRDDAAHHVSGEQQRHRDQQERQRIEDPPEHVARRPRDHVEAQPVEPGQDHREEHQQVGDPAEQRRRGPRTQDPPEPEPFRRPVEPHRGEQVRHHRLRDPGNEPPDQENDDGAEHVRQEGDDLIHDRLDREQHPLQVERGQDRRQEQEEDDPVDDLGHRVRDPARRPLAPPVEPLVHAGRLEGHPYRAAEHGGEDPGRKEQHERPPQLGDHPHDAAQQRPADASDRGDVHDRRDRGHDQDQEPPEDDPARDRLDVLLGGPFGPERQPDAAGDPGRDPLAKTQPEKGPAEQDDHHQRETESGHQDAQRDHQVTHGRIEDRGHPAQQVGECVEHSGMVVNPASTNRRRAAPTRRWSGVRTRSRW